MPRDNAASEDSDRLDEGSIPPSEDATIPKDISGGSFRGMGLILPLQKAIRRKGYSQPTPIQRKSVVPLLSGRDVVGMARTGSGKTAAFLIPMIQKLKCHSAKFGARALVLCPSRELALQTYVNAQHLGKFTDLRYMSAIGGESMDDQFTSLASNPDVIVATPGRLLHLCSETSLSLKSIEFFVIDEADRMFEMGFQEQLNELIEKLPDARQTALFSATLPQSLAEFTKIGLRSPLYIRLDAENKLSPDLSTLFYHIRPESKEPLLLWCLKSIYGAKAAAGQPPLTIVFASTKHHVEYLHALLACVGYKSSVVYGTLDQEARTMALDSFKSRKTCILIVTDVAARGLDVPLLDNVINFDFPSHPKLFVHRVGRVARAGNSGTAYSFTTPADVPYFLDLKLMLGDSDSRDLTLGKAPQSVLDDELGIVESMLAGSSEVQALKAVAANAQKLYVQTRPVASAESHKRAKSLQLELHSSFGSTLGSALAEQSSILDQLRQYKRKGARIEARPPKAPKTHQPSIKEASKFKEKEFYVGYTAKTSSDSFMNITVDPDFTKALDLEKKTAKKNVKRNTSSDKSAYENWQKKSHLSLPKLGQAEVPLSKLPAPVARSRAQFFKMSKKTRPGK